MGLFEARYVQYAPQVSDWQEAIRQAGRPLLDDGKIAQDYIDEILATCRAKGPYMNIGPDIVLAHARPLPSTHEASAAVLLTGTPVKLLDDAAHAARLWIFLATPDETSHIALIQQLAMILMNPERLQSVLAAQSSEELLRRLAG